MALFRRRQPAEDHLEAVVPADFTQFWLLDAEAGADDLADDPWDDDAFVARVAADAKRVAVLTQRHEVPVRVDVEAGEPPDDLEPFDHVVDCGLSVPSGRLVLADPTTAPDDAPALAVEPGTYRVRVFASLEANEERYRIVLWPGEPTAVRALKTFVGR